MSINIGERVRFHADRLDDPTPLNIATELAADIIASTGGKRDELMEAIVALALPAIRVSLNQGRSSATTAYKRSVVGVSPAGSNRFERRRSAWTRMLDERVLVGGVYKRQGDCTVEDLQAAMADRQDHIARVKWHIDRLAAFIWAMEREGVDTLGELPEGAVDEAVLAVAA